MWENSAARCTFLGYGASLESSLNATIGVLETPSDLDLVRRARAGERAAFGELVRRHQGHVIGLCLTMLGEAEAEDAAQQAFLKAWRSLEGFAGGSAFSTWLYRIASNHCLDLLRQRARARTDSLDELVEREGEGVARMLGSAAGPGGALEAKDLAARILGTLPEEQRLALVLCETQGLSYQEIAEVMECSVDSVKARLRRARETLDNNLRHFLAGPGV